MIILMNDRSLPPIYCDKCDKGFHPSCVFKTKRGKNICIWCIRELISKWKLKDQNVNFALLLEKMLDKQEYKRFLLTYGTLGDEKLFV